MKQFTKRFFIFKAIRSIFVLFSIDATSIDVTKLSGLSENNKKNGTLPKKFCQKVIQG